MNKLRSIAFYALVTPAMTLGAGSVLAEQDIGQDANKEKQSSQYEQSAGQSDSQMQSENKAMRDQSSMQNQGYMASAPANGMQASDLIGAEVRTNADENVGSIGDLIIDQNGQVVAVVVGVGGFLGMGEKEVAIGWEHITTSGTSEQKELRVDVTRDDLRAAPEFEKQD